MTFEVLPLIGYAFVRRPVQRVHHQVLAVQAQVVLDSSLLVFLGLYRAIDHAHWQSS